CPNRRGASPSSRGRRRSAGPSACASCRRWWRGRGAYCPVPPGTWYRAARFGPAPRLQYVLLSLTAATVAESVGTGSIPQIGQMGHGQITERGPVDPGPERKGNVRLVTIATAATGTATAPAAATITAAATAAGALFARPGDVNRQGASAQLFAIQCVDGLLRLLRRVHGDEGEPARTAGCPVHHQVGFDDRAVGRKGVLQVVFSDVEGKIPNKQFFAHVMSLTVLLS